LSTFEPQTESLDLHAISAIPHRTPAYIYTDEEIVTLLETVPRMHIREAFRITTYQTLLGLLASTGMRISEALHLDITNINLSTGVLHIRRSKFRKSRIVPVHPTTRERLECYTKMRAERGVLASEPAFFVGLHLKRLRYAVVNNFFRSLRRKANLQSTTKREPRLHDLRHTFAVRRILAWYEAGVDVQTKLPLLATYMGHAHFEDTAYYLEAGGELLAKAAEHFEQHRSRAHD
jgi:integrase